jgi:hypothetical protein
VRKLMPVLVGWSSIGCFLETPLEAKWPAGFNPEAHLQTDVPSATKRSKWNVKEINSEERALVHLPLDQISNGTPITRAQEVMLKAGFKCWDEHDDLGQSYLGCSKYLDSHKGFSSSLVSDEIRVWIPYEAGKVVDVKAKEFLTGP